MPFFFSGSIFPYRAVGSDGGDISRHGLCKVAGLWDLLSQSVKLSAAFVVLGVSPRVYGLEIRV